MLSSLSDKGYKITSIKASSLLSKMKLKKGDIILSIEQIKIQNRKQAYKILSQFLKKQKKLSISIKRNAESLFLVYDIEPYKNKKKITLSKIEKLNKPEQIVTEKNKIPDTRKTLVPEKYKAYMQIAFVSSLNSFVYKKPDFDSLKLYPLPIGKKILISKKIFRPPHNFGSFYKVFLFKETKVIGYISEAEVIPEFKRVDKEFKPNPSYKLAKKYVQSNKILDLDSITEIKNSSKKTKKRKQKKLSSQNNKYVGLSFGSILYDMRNYHNKEDWFIGFKFSGYNLLISYLNLDINIASSFDRRRFYLDMLASYPVLRTPNFYLLAMGGLLGSLHLDRNLQMKQDSVDYGIAGAVSLLIPIKNNLIFKVEGKTGYQIRKPSFPIGLSGSLQVTF